MERKNKERKREFSDEDKKKIKDAPIISEF